MLAIIAAIALAAQPAVGVPPEVAYRLATADLVFNVPPERHAYTRYLDLTGIDSSFLSADRTALEFTLNSTSFQTRLVRFPIVYGTLVRLDLEELGWDKYTRQDDLDKLASLGVHFVKPGTRHNPLFVDIWEDITRTSPYFRAPRDGKRGWVYPQDDRIACHLSQSQCFIVRANWLLPKLMTEAKDGGFYSQILLLPNNEKDLYKRLGISIEFIDAQDQAKHGGAVIQSIVALRNRELQMIQGSFGPFWRTFDFKPNKDPLKNVLLTFAGKVKHDGREIIFRLPNGLHGYYLADGKGTQVNSVPSDIAIDKRSSASHSIVDRNVVNAYKCVSCHGPESGIIPFADQIKAGITSRGVVFGVINYDPRQVVLNQKRVREYYLSELEGEIVKQQADYTDAIGSLTRLDPGANADGFVTAFDRYTWGLVTPLVASSEMGLTLEKAKDVWFIAHDRHAALLHGGRPIPREAWELSYPAVQLATIKPWEKPLQTVPVKPPGY